MKALVGRGSIAPTHSRSRLLMGVSGQRHAPVALYPRGKGGWVGPRAGVDTETRRKIIWPLPGIEPRLPGRSARHQTLY
jgi:hypothetical protein